MILSFVKGQFILSNCNERIAEKLEKSRTWQKQKQTFCYATTEFRAAAKFKAVADRQTLKLLNRVFVKRFPPNTSPLPSFLDPHQVDGVNWILTRSRSYLAHAPGAGKTLQAIVAAQLAEAKGQVLFVVPPTLTINWAREIAQWSVWRDSRPSVSIVPNSLNKESMNWEADYIICPDSMLTRPWVLDGLKVRAFKLVAVDEASRFKESTAKRTIALFGGSFQLKLKKSEIRSQQITVTSPGLVQRARHAVLLDGSPMPNRPMELWAPVYAMAPEVINFMSQSDFGFRYCGAFMNEQGKWEFNGASNLEELKARLQESFMHVVTEDKLSHPERLRSMIFMNEDPRTAQLIKWEKKNVGTINLSEISEDGEIPEELATYRRELGISKVSWIAKYVRERLEDGEKILLFAWHREVCQALFEEFKNRPGLVMGGTSEQAREMAFRSFQDGHLDLIVGNIGAMGRGHNLQRADRVVFGEFSWTDELNKQCEKRASRKGSDKLCVPCDYIVVPDSLDEIILNSVFKKAQNVKRVIG